jgi:hypothetical protein
MIVVVGPAPCIGCGNLVWYGRLPKGRGQTAKLNRWRNSDGTQHRCKRETEQ